MIGQEGNTEKGLRGVLPIVSIFIFILLMQVQYKIKLVDGLFPFLSLAAVYYWCIFKPHLVPVSAVFFLGLLQDLLSGGPLGMTPLLLILVRIAVIRQGMRLLEREFLFSWLVFFVLALVFGLSNWSISSLYLREPQNLWNALAQSMVTIAIFPAIAWLLGWLRNLLAGEVR